MAAKIGILGGTFNPIHIGHLLLAEQAYEEYHLDQILFMPSGVSYFKDCQMSILSGKMRSDMVSLAIQGNSHFAMSDMEIKRSGNTYTCDTMLELRQEYSEDTLFYFIIGADTLYSMKKWKDVQIVFKNCIIVSAVRDEISLSMLQKQADEYQQQYQAEIRFLSLPNIDISSHLIRKKVYLNQSIRYYVPASVEEYIHRQSLYQKKVYL